MKNLFKYIFTTRPKTLGDGLNRVKNHFNAVGNDIIGIPGRRIYETPCGNKVHIISGKNKLKITKILDDLVAKTDYKSYIGKCAEIIRAYNNKVGIHNKVVVLDRSKITKTFSKIKPDGEHQFPALKMIYDHVEDGIPKHFMTQVRTHKSYRTKTIPYAKAVAMGMKV